MSQTITVPTIGQSSGFTAVQNYTYDSLNRLKSAEEAIASVTSWKQTYTFDRYGNRRFDFANGNTTFPDPNCPEAICNPTISTSNNRLTSTGWQYDNAGNTINDPEGRTFIYDGENKQKEVRDQYNTVIGQYFFDGDGKRVKKIVPATGEVTVFVYDANGRMVKATETSVPDASTVYDALGNRVAAKVNDVWQVMVYDAFGKLVAEYGESEPPASAGGQSARLKYIQQDWQGSVRTVSNQNGYVISRYDHTAYGETIGAGVGLRSTLKGYFDSPDTRQGYVLTERDDATGLDHTWFRKNEGQAGRWTSPDPYLGSMSIGNPQSFNRYSYVSGDPVNFVDPSGLFLQPPAPFISFWEFCILTGLCGNGSPPQHLPIEGGGGGGVGIVGDTPCPPGPTNCALDKLREKEREVQKRREMKEREAKKEQDFYACLKSKMEAANSRLRTIVMAGTLGTAGASLEKAEKGVKTFVNGAIFFGVHVTSQIKRVFALSGTLAAIQNYAPEYNEIRKQAIRDCRKETGYSGPIKDQRSIIFRPAFS